MHSFCPSLKLVLCARLQFALCQPATASSFCLCTLFTVELEPLPCAVTKKLSNNSFLHAQTSTLELLLCTPAQPLVLSLLVQAAVQAPYPDIATRPQTRPVCPELAWFARGVCMQGRSCFWHFPFSLLRWYLQFLLNILMQKMWFWFCLLLVPY